MNEKPKLNIILKEKKDDLHPEFLAKVFVIDGKKIPFVHQKTPANCGPLAIINGIDALNGINEKYSIPKDFPTSSKGIRKLLANDEELRKYYKVQNFSEKEKNDLREKISKDDYGLQGEHVANLIKKLTRDSNLMISVDRFSSPGFVAQNDFNDRVMLSDWLILQGNNHYKSFVKLNDNEWISIDSMNSEPVKISKNLIENYFRTIPPKIVPMYMAMKVVKNKIIITKK